MIFFLLTSFIVEKLETTPAINHHRRIVYGLAAAPQSLRLSRGTDGGVTFVPLLLEASYLLSVSRVRDVAIKSLTWAATHKNADQHTRRGGSGERDTPWRETRS